ncbi:MAG: hypothetical protein JWN72_517, partial [Thermoleophilia bacterium]|nr:hypothetical protein [Thermoleophilia bacterium]
MPAPRSLSVLVSISLLALLAAGAAPAFGAGEAVTYQNTLGHDGASTTTLPATPALKWNRDLGNLVSYPVVARNKAFVTVKAASSVTVTALNLSTGATVWTQSLSSSSYAVTPAYDDGRIFVVSGSGLAAAYNADTGVQLWTRQLSQSSFSSPPTAANGLVYYGGAG